MAGVPVGAAMQDPHMQQFVNRETQRQRFQGIVHEMTGRCWDTCLPGNPGTKIDSRTENCIKNCVERFLDTSTYVVNRLESGAAAPTPPKEEKVSSWFS